MAYPDTAAFVRDLRRFSSFAGLLTALAAASLLLSNWLASMDAMRRVLPGYATMKANTAVGFIGGGLALSLLQRPANGLRWLLASTLAALPILIGALTLVLYAFSARDAAGDLYVDMPFGRFGASGLPAFNSALGLLFCGLAVLMFDHLVHGWRLRMQWLALAAAVLGFIGLLGYLYGAHSLHEGDAHGAMSLPTTLLLLLLALGILSAQPLAGFVGVLAGPGAGGHLARRLLPAVIVLPPVMGLALLIGRRAGYYDPSSGLVIMVMTNVAVFAVLAWWSARSLERSWARQRRAEEALRGSNALLETRTEELARANESLHRLSLTDALTGICNRRCFETSLETLFKQAKRYGTEFSLLIMDVDKFKSYNDAFGHPQGDIALREVARVLRAHARDSDFVARMGGEEFGVLLPRTGSDGAMILAERFRQGIEATVWPNRPITISIGVATFRADVASPDYLLKLADEALYQAKGNGRNCVVRADVPAGAPDTPRG
ncbi:MAG: GGDEF domain-containing protein [Betaproteobacteria bacterium]|nr:GGDEF domain-containing protein [Betaproteobacteria bacterium]